MLCWARCLGNCAKGVSAEHIVSESIFPRDLGLVRVHGGPWPWGKKAKTLSIKSLTRKNLCGKHNEDLSPLDKAASDFFKASLAAKSLLSAREKDAASFTPVTITVDAGLLERWLLKTMLNHLYNTQAIIWPGNESRGIVSEVLVRRCFGLEPFPSGSGMFRVKRELDQRIPYRVHLWPKSYTDDDGHGSRSVFYGMAFQLPLVYLMLHLDPIMSIDPELLRVGMPIGDDDNGPWREFDVEQRPTKMPIYLNERGLSHVVEFDWSSAV
jgi:hypothetical protein